MKSNIPPLFSIIMNFFTAVVWLGLFLWNIFIHPDDTIGLIFSGLCAVLWAFTAVVSLIRFVKNKKQTANDAVCDGQEDTY